MHHYFFRGGFEVYLCFGKPFAFIPRTDEQKKFISAAQIKAMRGEPVRVRFRLEMRVIDSDGVLQALRDMPRRYELHLRPLFSSINKAAGALHRLHTQKQKTSTIRFIFIIKK